MILTKEETERFDNAARPLIQYLAENHHPHMKVIVDCSSAEILESSRRYITDKFIL